MAYQPKSYKKFVATAATATLVATAVAPTALAANFDDVNLLYKDAVDYLVANNIANGISDTKFGTGLSITRGDAAVMIANALKLDLASAKDAGFTDLNSRVKASVNALYAEGIINGKTATTFAPGDIITRQEMAKIVALAYDLKAGSTKNEFVDVNSTWDPYVDALLANGITFGKNATMFASTDAVTRGEFALFMYRAETMEAPAPVVGYSLDVTVADADSTITADGADNTLVTVKVLKDGVVDTSFKGTVKFQSLKNATFAKETVAFDKGVATVQVNSISSSVAIVDTIVATIADAPDMDDLVGLNKNVNLSYVPANAGNDIEARAFITYAESDRASDVFVRFNKAVSLAAVKKDLNDLTVSDRDGNKSIAGVEQVNETTFKLILAQGEALVDNTTIKVSSAQAGSEAFIDSDYSFRLVDPKAPEAVRVTIDSADYRVIRAEFTEPVTSNTAGNIGNLVLNGKQLTAADVVGGVPTVGTYNATTGVDSRNIVTLQLTTEGLKKLNSTVGGSNLLQAYNVADYAGLTDTSGQNVATTQEFTFATPAKPAAPVVKSVVTHSPEQFLVTFDQAVQKEEIGGYLTAADFTFERLVNDAYVSVPVNDAFTDGNAVTVTPLSATEYLIEMNSDWTTVLNTAGTGINYYSPKYNKVRIGVESDNIESVFGIDMVADSTNVQTLTLDSTSPTIAKAEQARSNANALLNKVNVVMSEPVQLDAAEYTPSEQQGSDAGVPKPTFEFVNADGSRTVQGTLEAGSLSEEDTKFTVVPESTLENGEWTLYIRSISDDVGNTSATVSAKVTIATATAVGESKIIWAQAFDNVNTAGDAAADEDTVFIQFGTTMSLDALRSNIYTINGKILPVGTRITSESKQYESNGTVGIQPSDLSGTLVKITLPRDFFGDTSATALQSGYTTDYEPAILNVSKSLKDSKGNAIKSPTEVELTYGQGMIME